MDGWMQQSIDWRPPASWIESQSLDTCVFVYLFLSDCQLSLVVFLLICHRCNGPQYKKETKGCVPVRTERTTIKWNTMRPLILPLHTRQDKQTSINQMFRSFVSILLLACSAGHWGGSMHLKPQRSAQVQYRPYKNGRANASLPFSITHRVTVYSTLYGL